jgi:hypothetical protein
MQMKDGGQESAANGVKWSLGIITLGTGFVHTFAGLCVCRFLLGTMEGMYHSGALLGYTLHFFPSVLQWINTGCRLYLPYFHVL